MILFLGPNRDCRNQDSNAEADPESFDRSSSTLKKVTTHPAKTLYQKLAGTIKANGQLVITMRSNSMPLNNDGDTITLLEGKTVRQIVSCRKQQAGDGKVVKAGKK